MKNHLALFICMIPSFSVWCQNKTVIDEQLLTNGRSISLVSYYSDDQNKLYGLEITDRLTQDTITHYIDNIQHAH